VHGHHAQARLRQDREKADLGLLEQPGNTAYEHESFHRFYAQR